MPSDIWFPLYIGDYLSDTMHLDSSGHGAYLLLLFSYYKNRGPLIDDDRSLANIARVSLSDWPATRSVVARFFDIRDGMWFHKRADIEIKKSQTLQEARKQGALKTNAKRYGGLNVSPTVSLSESHTETQCDIHSHSQSHIQSESDSESKTHSKKDDGLSALGLRICKWFHRRAETKWAASDLKKLKSAEGTPEDEVGLLENYYTSQAPYRRKDISTLLNNWASEIDRAREYKKNPNGHTTTKPNPRNFGIKNIEGRGAQTAAAVKEMQRRRDVAYELAAEMVPGNGSVPPANPARSDGSTDIRLPFPE